jgi:hypothetical protein
MKFYKKASFFSFFLFPLILLISCTSTTGTSTGSLTGVVQLEGETDHSGIVVGIYELAELDPDIIEANQKWPHIGVIVTQHTEFDHRFGTLVKTGETDASGYFEITDIPTGVYNVVATKDGFGFRYIYNVQISSGDNTLPTAKAILTLYSETLINSDISSPTTWQTDHHYIINQDIIVDDELTIEPGTVIRLNEGKEITSYGNFTAVGENENFIWFTKNDGFSEDLNTIDPDSNYIWDRVTLEPYSQAQMQWCKFDWANIGLLNHMNGFEISDCIFRSSQCGFKAEDADSCFCSNLLCEEIKNEEQSGIYFSQVANGCIEKNIVNVCENGMIIKDGSNPEVHNNFLIYCNTSIRIKYSSSPIVSFNEIADSNFGIIIAFGSLPNILNNNIKSNIGFYSYIYLQPIDIKYNNLKSNSYSFRIGLFENNFSDDINATHNYFYTIDSNTIEMLIYDKNDVEESQQIYIGEVFYIPFLNQEYPQAGIQGE